MVANIKYLDVHLFGDLDGMNVLSGRKQRPFTEDDDSAGSIRLTEDFWGNQLPFTPSPSRDSQRIRCIASAPERRAQNI